MGMWCLVRSEGLEDRVCHRDRWNCWGDLPLEVVGSQPSLRVTQLCGPTVNYNDWSQMGSWVLGATARADISFGTLWVIEFGRPEGIRNPKLGFTLSAVTRWPLGSGALARGWRSCLLSTAFGVPH